MGEYAIPIAARHGVASQSAHKQGSAENTHAEAREGWKGRRDMVRGKAGVRMARRANTGPGGDTPRIYTPVRDR